MFEILGVVAFLSLFGLMIMGGVYILKDMKYSQSKNKDLRWILFLSSKLSGCLV